jgi:hypothetical protein
LQIELMVVALNAVAAISGVSKENFMEMAKGAGVSRRRGRGQRLSLPRERRRSALYATRHNALTTVWLWTAGAAEPEAYSANYILPYCKDYLSGGNTLDVGFCA